ncbi:hypothetical protein EYZ11_006813 [Aspergillus tanneri]|uniref:AB hydrolase-1 domain-containing protein n=1 Tax=Aspergillus tanneri TaxID=1220188 RepID=A0A4S3JEU4_9EURO|nr:uncharacterized protein ATNIH1004_011340 [Aspergillus tanneri]KAA8642396.1 hypothetical protein ATNIH1004_011340 [Aspergillus tanneri]THC93702.1 hypothetical protein EYZ11_006813 [Aspergillus tanneri]
MPITSRGLISTTRALSFPEKSLSGSPTSQSSISIDRAKESQTLTLSNGRTLGFAEYGNAQGKPLLYFHGYPACRYEGAFHDVGIRYGARVLAIDRPGMGLSTFQPSRKLLDWPGDVAEFATKLGLRDYRVLGGSGGGPYSLVCAKALPKEKLKGVGVLSGFAPFEAGTKGMPLGTRVMWNLGAWFPGLIGKYCDWTIVPAAQNQDPTVLEDLLLKTMNKKLDKTDSSVVSDEKNVKAIVRIIRESFREGSRGYVEDGKILTRPWGFDLKDIDFKGVRIFHGDSDQQAPIAMARWMAERIPGSVLTEWKDYSHFTINNDHVDEVFNVMMEK